MILGDDWQAYFQILDYRNRVDVFLVQKLSGEKVRILQPDGGTLEIDQYETTEQMKPTFKLRREHLQAIADGLAEKGILANSRRFTTEIDLIKNHLEDMRKLVFKEPNPL